MSRGYTPREHGTRPVPGEWADDAACRGHDPSRWQPLKTTTRRQIDAAKAICAGCPVRDACLEHGLRWDEPGIWGGMMHNERRRLAIGLDPATGTGTCTRCGERWTLTSTAGRIAKCCPPCNDLIRKGAA